ncbi:hypothetical protein ACQQCD_06390 [Pseudarthrobacter sp. J1763]|uniref:hypothetical protein n=1 Tax=Pseudarthrobacter sp. J1763 TaxID=3420445 RepID=UPI003D2AC596
MTRELTAGHTRISTTALVRLAEALTAEAFGIDRSKAGAKLADDGGRVAISVNVQLPIPQLTAENSALSTSRRATVYERAQSARTNVGDRFTELSGSTVSRIDFRILGSGTEEKAPLR